MRPFHILNNLDNTPKLPRPAREFTLKHALAAWVLIALLWTVMLLTGCDMATAQAVTAADSTRAADTTGAPSSQIMGAWRAIDTESADSVLGYVFLADGRYFYSSPSWQQVGNNPVEVVARFESGTWVTSQGSLVLSSDSSGYRLDSTETPDPEDRCDSATGVCWWDSDNERFVLPYVVLDDTLTIGNQTFRRVKL